MTKETAFQVKFWSPYTLPFEEAENSVIIKAPEEGNKEKRARNQSVARTRAGNVLVYDRGNNYNTNFSLDFKEVPDIERAQLLVFLEAIQWATTKICYQDMYGDIYIVRCLQENGITYEDRGTDIKRGPSNIRWGFSLDLLNLTDNIAELSIADGNVSNALSLHIANVNDPHNPEVCFDVDTADGTRGLEGYLTTDWRSVIYTVLVSRGPDSATFVIGVTHNRDGDTDADVVDIEQILVTGLGSVASNIYFTASLISIGLFQTFNLNIQVINDGWRVCIRRTKMGAA